MIAKVAVCLLLVASCVTTAHAATVPNICKGGKYQITPPTGWSVQRCGPDQGAWAKAAKDRAEVGVVATPEGLFDDYAAYVLGQAGAHASHVERGVLHLAGATWHTTRARLDRPWMAVLFLATTHHGGIVYTIVTDVQTAGNPATAVQAAQIQAAIMSFRFLG